MAHVPTKHSASYRLTQRLAATHGGAVLCLDERGYGRSYRLHAERPGPALNARLSASVIGPEGDVIGPAAVETPEGPAVTRVDIRGPIEQRAGYHDECGGWSDGHDAIAERMIAALEIGDVVLVVDSPGGAAAGLQEAVRRVVEEKAEHGRRIYVYADEMIGSAAYWWAAVVGDEIYTPEAGIVGSIGARSSHDSIVGALAQDGVEVTYFAWPGPGKVAFAPELPLSDLGKQRGERDVAIAGEAFCAAVCAARGCDRESIVELDADALTGQLAVNARLADGVASLEDVIAHALQNAGAQDVAGMAPDASIGTDEGVAARSGRMAIRSEGAPGARAEAGEDEEEDKGPSAPDKVPSDCGACGLVNEEDAKYCKGCGASLGTKPDMDHDEPDGDEPPAAPPGKAPAPAKHPPPPPQVAKAYASIAEACGLRVGASELAIKTAVVRMRQSLDRDMAATGARTIDERDGHILSLVSDAKRLAKVEGEMRAMQDRADERERMDLLRKLSAAGLPGYTRGELLVDHVDETSGKRTVHAAPMYAEMKLGTLRGLVASKLAHAPSQAPRRGPFEPDAKHLESAGNGVTASDRELAQKHGYDPEKVAAARNALFNTNGANGASRGV